MFNAKCVYLPCLDANCCPDAILLLNRGDGWETIHGTSFYLNDEKTFSDWHEAVQEAASMALDLRAKKLSY